MRSAFGKFIAAALWVVFIGFLAYHFYYQTIPCQSPIEYKIGTVDPGFNVSAAELKADLAKAGALWSTAAGKTLFEYNPNGAVTVNLVYDDRQKLTNQEQALTSNIDATSQVAQSVKDQFESLKSSYNLAQADYSTALSGYNQSLDAYNTEVAYWNAKGGAPHDQYQKLQTEKAALADQRTMLEAKRQNVNSLAGQINALIDKYNLLVAHINDNVSAINNDGLAGTQFEEGVYISDDTGKRINIYQFDNQTTFLRVLAHEMGHSLGLEHDAGSASIMNPINQGTMLALSTEDKAALKALCKL
jgi:hypothetical protein